MKPWFYKRKMSIFVITLLVLGVFATWGILSGNFKTWADALTGRETISLQKEQKIRFIPGQVIVKVKSEVVSRGVAPEQSLQELNQKFKVKKTEKVFTNPTTKEVTTRKKDKPVTNLQNIIKLTFPIQTDKSPKNTSPKTNFRINEVRRTEYTPEEVFTEMVVAEYKNSPQVEYAEPNYIYETQEVPNDPYYSSRGSWGQDYDDLWGLKKIKAEEAWTISQGDGVVVAVVDTGVDYNHEDIQENIWINQGEIDGNGLDDDNNGFIDDIRGWDFSSFFNEKPRDNDPMDDVGHGTHVAGTIAAVGNNGKGIIGVAPKAKIMALKAGDDEGFYAANLADSIKYGVDMGAKVINMSWGGPGKSSLLKESVDYAYGQNIVLVASAGNDNLAIDGYIYPSSYHNVISVASSDHNDKKTDFSNYGSEIDVIAPGGDSLEENTIPNNQYNILSLKLNAFIFGLPGGLIIGNNYLRLGGTSMAAPHVSGLAALIFQKNSNLTNEEVRQIISSSADDLVYPKDNTNLSGWDEFSGYGRINAIKALQTSTAAAYISSPSPGSQFKDTETFQILGSAYVEQFKKYTIEYGNGRSPEQWTILFGSKEPVYNNQLFQANANVFPEGISTIKLTVEDLNGKKFQDRIIIVILKNLHANFPLDLGNFWNISNPLTVDLNQDNKKEIIFAKTNGLNQTLIYAIQENGQSLMGWPRSLNGSFSGSISAGNVNGGTDLELIITTKEQEIETDRINILKNNGDLLNSFTLESIGGTWISNSMITIGDMNNDGQSELIFISTTYWENDQKLYVIKYDGQVLSGWPKEIVQTRSTVLLGDIENNGTLEIIVISLLNDLKPKTTIDVFTNYGQIVSGWPKIISAGAYEYASQGLLADIDNDKKLEIITWLKDSEANNYILYILKNNGQTLYGWPKRIPISDDLIIYNFQPVGVGNIDQDSKLEIFTVYNSSSNKEDNQ